MLRKSASSSSATSWSFQKLTTLLASLVIMVHVKAVMPLSPCYNPRWSNFTDTNSIYSPGYFNVTNDSSCKEWCLTNPTCVGVDVDHKEVPIQCWPHYNVEDFNATNVYNGPGITQYRLTCDNITVPNVPYDAVQWLSVNDTSAYGAPMNFPASSIQDCLDWCLWNTSCVGVDVQYNILPVVCWIHTNLSYFVADNLFPLTGTQHFELAQRCPNSSEQVTNVSSVWPTFGPQSGGTIVTITGQQSFDVSTVSYVEFGDLELHFDRSNSRCNSLVYITNPANTSYLGQLLPVTIRFVFENEALQTGFTFRYLLDPLFVDVQPRQLSIGGGDVVNITGIGLNSLPNPYIQLRTICNGSSMITISMCQIPNGLSNGTRLTCAMPKVSLPPTIESILVNKDAEISDPNGTGVVARLVTNNFTVDVFLGLSSLNYVREIPVDDSVKLQFYVNTARLCPPVTKVLNISPANPYLSIQWASVTRSNYLPSDFIVMVDKGQCVVINVTGNEIVCKPPATNSSKTNNSSGWCSDGNALVEVFSAKASYNCSSCTKYELFAAATQSASTTSTTALRTVSVSSTSSTTAIAKTTMTSNSDNLPLIIGLTVGLVGGLLLITLIIIIIIVVCARKRAMDETAFDHPLRNYMFNLPYNRQRNDWHSIRSRTQIEVDVNGGTPAADDVDRITRQNTMRNAMSRDNRTYENDGEDNLYIDELPEKVSDNRTNKNGGGENIYSDAVPVKSSGRNDDIVRTERDTAHHSSSSGAPHLDGYNTHRL